jgi:large subunit ribosomal protein L35
MPKMKSKRGAAKRFRVRPGGGIKRSQAYMRHILTKKSTKRKRHLRGGTEIDQSNKRQILSVLPYSR